MKNNKRLPRTDRQKKVISDLVYIMSSMALMNGFVQIVINPVMNSRLGSAALGKIVFYYCVISILSQSGLALCNSRLNVRRRYTTHNSDNLLYLLIAAPAAALLGVVWMSNYFGGLDLFLYALLMILTVLRLYGDVEYRMKLNYRRYFLYYLTLVGGYAAGVMIFLLTERWILVFLTGEISALAFTLISGRVFKADGLTKNVVPYFKESLCLSASYIMNDAVLNADKIILIIFADAAAVTLFYVTSLISKLFMLLVYPINNLMLSYMTREKSRLDTKSFLTGSLFIMLIGVVFYLGSMAATPVFVRIAYPSLYAVACDLVPLVSLGQIVGFVSSLIMTILLISFGVRKHLLIQLLFTAVYIPSSVLLTRDYGINGMVTSVLLSNAFKLALSVSAGVILFEKDRLKRNIEQRRKIV